MKIPGIIITLLLCGQIFAQETFPVNGVAENFEPVYAFTNAHIVINPRNEIENGILLIQGNKIIAVDSNLNIPDGAIIFDLNGDYKEIYYGDFNIVRENSNFSKRDNKRTITISKLKKLASER